MNQEVSTLNHTFAMFLLSDFKQAALPLSLHLLYWNNTDLHYMVVVKKINYVKCFEHIKLLYMCKVLCTTILNG